MHYRNLTKCARKPRVPVGFREASLANAIVYLRSMQIVLAHIGPRPSSRDPLDGMTATYLERCEVYARSLAEAFRHEAALFDWIDRQQRRAPAVTVLLDSRG